MEGLALLGEGVPAASVEQAALQAGYPVGPLAVTDEVNLTLMADPQATRRGAAAAGRRCRRTPARAVIDR